MRLFKVWGDWDVSNVVPGRTYQVIIESHTNNDTDGGFWITVD